MANTLKFGNGKWAVKEGSFLAYNDENDRFKPLPFTFDRSSSATRVNEQGLIEVVPNNEPRIDFLSDSNGALLLEPNSTNIITYSEDFSNATWVKTNSTISSNQIIAPDGSLTADKLVTNNGITDGKVESSDSALVAPNGVPNDMTSSIFVKKGEWDKVAIYMRDLSDPSTMVEATFNLEDGTLGGLTSSGKFSGPLASAIEYPNGWYRLYVGAEVNLNLGAEIVVGYESLDSVESNGDGTSGVYIWGAQFDNTVSNQPQSYPNSYIPTKGSAVTRTSETSGTTVPNGIINSSEGVLYIDTKFLGNAYGNNITSYSFSISDGSGDNEIRITNLQGFKWLTLRVTIGTSSQFNKNQGIGDDYGKWNKIAIKWEGTNWSTWLNGVELYTQVASSTFSDNVLNRIDFNAGAGFGPLHADIKGLRIYDKALTNAELQALTS